MNAHMIRIVEGPQAGDIVAANDTIFDVPTAHASAMNLTLVSAPAENDPASADSNTDNAEPATTNEPDDYVLGGYAGI
jgi:hypothetical protein